MSKLLKSVANLIIRVSLSALVLALVIMLSFYTPIFSTVGLWVLNLLPIPQVNHDNRQVSDPSLQLSKNFSDPKLEDIPTSLDLKFKHQPTAYVVLGGGLTQADTYQQQREEESKNNYNNSDSNDQKDNNQKDNKQPQNRQIKSGLSSSGYQSQNRFANSADKSEKSTNQTSSLHTPSMNNIVLNEYSLKRMQTVMKYQQIKPLPIVLTGVDAPWMQDWLLQHGIENIVTENASMNTCENARFTAKRLNLQDIYLITDAYHMTRARRQFALNGIHALPIPADLPMAKGWLSPENNVQHSRRTVYELAAYMRDVFVPQDNCRQASEVSFETLLRSRKPKDVETF